METIIIIIIAITLILLIGVTIRSNRAKKGKIDPLSPTQVKKEETTSNESAKDNNQPN